MNKKYIIFFDEIDKNDLLLVGGKGANLGEMTKAGFSVPGGFCVTTEAYKEFLAYNDLSSFIFQVIQGANLDNVKEIGEEIRKRVRLSQIPEEIKREVLSGISKAGVSDYYAVRSSATAEDLAFASFAGQQDTFLNIKGEKEIIGSVIDCWASLFTDRAILYRIQNNIKHEKVYMSVVVQKMILPEVSGIMFTADPVSGHRGIVSIDASYGLGEALVSGIVSPDVYKVRKDSRSFESKSVAVKKLAIMPVKGGGTQKIEISGEKAINQVMTDNFIFELADLGRKIEQHYGCPQDIEWCQEKEKLYVVQSRPITSLFPLPAPIPKDNALHVYLSFNHLQVMTEPISPLGIDILRNIFPLDQGAKSEDDYKYLKSAAGRIYIDMSGVLQIKKFRQGFPIFLQIADALMGEALKELVLRPDFANKLKKNKQAAKGLRKFLLPILKNALKNLTFKNPEGTIEFANDYIEKRIKTTEERLNSKQGISRLEDIYELVNFYNEFQVFMPKIAPGVISFKALEKLEIKFLGSKKYTDLIVKGLEGNITTEMGLQVGDLADFVRKSPELISVFENPNYRTLITRVNLLKGHDEFKLFFNSFLNKYGMRAAGEIDVAKERWVENPEPLVKSILATLTTSTEGAHRREYIETIEKAKSAAVEFVQEVEIKHGKFRARIIKRLVRVLRSMLPVREHPKYLIMNLIMIIKRVLLEEAQLLVQKGHLIEKQDVFYVSFWELRKAIENDKSLIDIVKLRKEQYQHFKKLNAPRVITSDGEEIKANYKRENLPEGALAGMPVSAGVIEGIARVITDPTNSSIGKGEILVAPFTDPGWTPLFINAAGLVMEVGGLLTHGTVVAREYGIPAVVGVTDATKKIRTGQKIRIDGNSGFVIIIEE